MNPKVSEHVARAKADHPKGRCDGAEPSSCRTKGLRQLQEPEVSEHVARAKATLPRGEVRWRGPRSTSPTAG